MLDLLIIGALFTGIIGLVSVCAYNIRRSRCVRCSGCGVVLERELMSLEAMQEDKLKIPTNLLTSTV